MGTIIQSGRPGRRASTLIEAVEDYLTDLMAQGKSPATVLAYGKDLRAFAATYRGELAGVTHPALAEYLRMLTRKDGSSLAPAGLARRRVSLRSFFSWCMDMRLVAADPAARLPSITVPDRQPRALPEADIDRVLATIRDPRDRLLFFLLADTGARVGEVLSIRLEKIRLHAREISVVGKRNRERTLYLEKSEAFSLLRAYLRANGWLDRDGETITVRGLLLQPDAAKQRAGRPDEQLHYTVAQKAWKRYALAAGVPDATIHQLRHSYGTTLINGGMRVEALQRAMGHRNIQTTMAYAAVSDETVKRALEAARTGRPTRRPRPQ